MALEWLKTILGDGYTEDIESKIAQEIGKGFYLLSQYADMQPLS